MRTNKWFSFRLFQSQKGMRKSHPISAYIFILCTEILNIKLKHDRNITGLKIKKEEYIISQSADDTTLFLDGSEKSIKSTLELLEKNPHIFLA